MTPGETLGDRPHVWISRAGKDPYARKPHDTDNTAAWRQRMGADAAQVIYKLRAQTAEWVNAMCRNEGFGGCRCVAR